MLKSILVLVVSLSSSTVAFLPALRQSSRSLTVVHSTQEDSVVDWKRAKHCAEHFGSCDVAEVEDLYQQAHKERIQHQLFGGIDLQHESSTEMEHRIIEEELELQLHLLDEEHERAEQEVKLFPEDMITSLPHLHEHADAEHEKAKVVDQYSSTQEPLPSRLMHRAEHSLIEQETKMGEDTLETIAMCAVVAGLVFLPQLMN